MREPESVETFHLKPGRLPYGCGYFFQVGPIELGCPGLRMGAGDRVRVDRFDLSSTPHYFAKTLAICFKFCLRHGLSIHLQEEALNDDRSNPRRLEQIFQNATEPNKAAVHLAEILLGPGVQFAPDL